MRTRDGIFLAIGTLIGLAGIFASILWTVEAGVVALTALGVFIVFLLVLQRRQLARIQKRTMTLVQSISAPATPDTATKAELKKVRQDSAISTKKLVGLLQAQQISIDLLRDELDRSRPEKYTR